MVVDERTHFGLEIERPSPQETRPEQPPSLDESVRSGRHRRSRAQHGPLVTSEAVHLVCCHEQEVLSESGTKRVFVFSSSSRERREEAQSDGFWQARELGRIETYESKKRQVGDRRRAQPGKHGRAFTSLPEQALLLR